MNKIIIPLPISRPRPIHIPRDIHRHNLSGELLGVQDVSGWSDEDVRGLAVAIQKRGDGSYAVLKERSEPV